MANVVVADGAGELDFERDDAVVAALDDQIDLMRAPVGTEMPDARFGRLGIHADVAWFRSRSR